MKTIEYTFTLPGSDIQHDMLTTMLGELGFDSFMDDDMTLKAYCSAEQRDDLAVEELLRMDAFKGLHLLDVTEMPDKDWNELWEASYQPVVINERCRVRAPFHEPDANYEFDLVIEPKMSFGTANHETTAQIIQLMLETDFKDKDVLDMGSGTAVLAILAKKLGAAHTVAIDNDEWAYKNAFTNIALNGINDIDIILGDAAAIQDSFNVVLANINRNILLQDMPRFVSMMSPGATLILSGFYEADCALLESKAQQLGLSLISTRTDGDWASMVFLY